MQDIPACTWRKVATSSSCLSCGQCTASAFPDFFSYLSPLAPSPHRKGEWVDDLPDGHGQIVYANGDRYEGSFAQGCRNGHGVLTLNNGMKFDGMWLRDLQHGEGVIVFPDGASYRGLWRDGKITDKGTFTSPTGRAGRWAHMCGSVEVHYPSAHAQRMS